MLGSAKNPYSVLDDILTDRLMLANIEGAKLVQIGCNNESKSYQLLPLEPTADRGWINRCNFYIKPRHRKPSQFIVTRFYAPMSMLY